MLEKIKWSATIALAIGVGGLSAGFYPFIWFQLLGCLLWLVATSIMKDKALITNNVIMTSICIIGMIFKSITGV